MQEKSDFYFGRHIVKIDTNSSSKNQKNGYIRYSGQNDDVFERSTENIETNTSKDVDDDTDPNTITILGSGDFGRALASLMVKSGYIVCIGSRNPEKNRTLMEKIGAKIMKTEDAIAFSHIIVMAIPKDYYKDQPLELLEGKIVIDVSNRTTVHRKEEISQAEYLQTLIPKSASVVKAFNVLSAYALESGGLQGTKEVLYAGDEISAKEKVSTMIRYLGFTPVDCGTIRNAREIEDIPVQRFPHWKIPLIISSLIFVWFFIWQFGKSNICDLIQDKLTWSKFYDRLSYLPANTMNKILASHALNMLAICYLPGCIAAYIQLVRGTKYSRFPNFLDQWLKMRKYLGLLMLLTASIHACISVADWEYHGEHKDHWRMECFLVAGVCAYALAVILGITSLPSVTNVLTWKEFAFVQSKLGWLCLIFGCAHTLFFSWPRLTSVQCHFFLHGAQYALWIPMLTIFLKIPLLLPCVDYHLTKIRGGWTRHIIQNKGMV